MVKFCFGGKEFTSRLHPSFCVTTVVIRSRVERFKAAEDSVRQLRGGSITTYGWHGTRGDYANSIKKFGFDMSKVTVHVYGKGAYFAKYAALSHPYAIPGAYLPEGTPRTVKSDTTLTMILCKLVTGKRGLGRQWMEAPDSGYDSARNGDDNYFVIFDGDAILPYAIVEYQLKLGRR